MIITASVAGAVVICTISRDVLIFGLCTAVLSFGPCTAVQIFSFCEAVLIFGLCWHKISTASSAGKFDVSIISTDVPVLGVSTVQ